jgi:hypothetical protein
MVRYIFANGSHWPIASPPHEWVITIAFYAALHDVDAYLCEHAGGGAGSHDARNRAVDTITQLQPIAFTYGHLYSRSLIARYDPLHPFSRSAVQAVLNDMSYVMIEIGKLL